MKALTKDERDARDERRRLAANSRLTDKIGIYEGGIDFSNMPYADVRPFDHSGLQKQLTKSITDAEESRSVSHDIRKTAAPQRPCASTETRLTANQNSASRLESRVRRQVAARALAADGNLITQAREFAAQAEVTQRATSTPLSQRAGDVPQRRSPSKLPFEQRLSRRRSGLPALEDYNLIERELLEKALHSREAAEMVLKSRDVAQGFSFADEATRLRAFAAAARPDKSSVSDAIRTGGEEQRVREQERSGGVRVDDK